MVVDRELFLIPGSKKNDLIHMLYAIEVRMDQNPGMTIEESVEAQGVSMTQYRKAVHLRAVRKRSYKTWGGAD